MFGRQQGSDAASNGGARKYRTGLILAGAAAKGPYAAGALKAISKDERFDVASVAGTSSGALNGAVYAAGLRVGEEKRAAELLCDLWKSKAGFLRIVRVRDRKKLLRDALEEFAHKEEMRSDVKFRAVASSLRGNRDRFCQVTYEAPFDFTASAFRDPERLDFVVDVCLASSAIPFVFAPHDIPGRGIHWDGGIVDNAPIAWALKTDAVDHLMVVSPEASEIGQGSYGRLSFGRLIRMLLDERLSRDLYEAKAFNRDLEELYRKGIDVDKLRPELKWRLLQIVEIRPAEDLKGSMVRGFFDKPLRENYLALGEQGASAELQRWRPKMFDTRPRARSFPRDEPPPADGAGRVTRPRFSQVSTTPSS